ncbi:MAG: nucleoside hydrolase [Chloroflexota bacterium]
MQRLLIDTDCGSDDAVALLIAFRSPDVRVEAITTVAGNVGMEQATRNTLYTMELCGADVPVYKGLAKPLLAPHADAKWVHGDDGMGNQNFPPPKAMARDEHAVDALIRLIRANPGELTLVTLGPLSNIAVALMRDPEIAGLVKETVVMGGAANVVANVTPSAEYNIWEDPEAARIVFQSGMPLLMVGIELCRGDAVFNPEDQRRLRAMKSRYADFVLDINQFLISAVAQYGIDGIDMPDPITMAIAINRALLLESAPCFVDIETTGELTRGETVVDRFGVWGKPANCTVGLRSDGPAFKQFLEALLVE